MKTGSRAFPSTKVQTPASRNSFTRRSCNVLCARSTRPRVQARGRLLVWLELAQRVQRAAKLRHPIAAERTGLVDTKHPMLVAVERNRFTSSFEVGSRRME